ncbi:hypothetical protein BDN71DRAFT_1430169 [Pleurotus eryngii]|uniref:Uncharacterized protein n=1 Tax=Pleurotus eryngii TaxID=5323 RepID=A0A9P6A1N3_PLEER|nr:hypothetical protein BDN71DRAFT_1430169 [Pleurotus eryngii]
MTPMIPLTLTCTTDLEVSEEALEGMGEVLVEMEAVLAETEVGMKETEADQVVLHSWGGLFNPLPHGRNGPGPTMGPGDPDSSGNPPDPPPSRGNIAVPAPQAPLEFCWQFSFKIPLSFLPKWDGKLSTVIQYISELSYYQLLRDDVTNHLARIAPFRFTGLTRMWFNRLSLNDQLHCTVNMTNFLIFIREQFMHEEWQHNC